MNSVRTLSVLTVLNILNAGLALVSSVVIAYLFGTGRPVEIFLAASGLHATVASLAQTGQLTEVLLPAYHRLRESQGRQAAYQAYSAFLNRMLLPAVVVGLVVWLLAKPLASLRVPGFRSEEIMEAAAMFRWIVPLIVIQVAAELLKTLGNAERLFGAPEIVSAAARVMSLVVLVTLAGTIDTWALVVSLWCAGLVELLGIVLVLRRCDYRHRFSFALPEEARRVGLFRKFLGTLPYVLATQVLGFVMDAGVSHLSQGSFAVYRYATMIWSRTTGIFIRPVSVPFFTDISESTARGSTGSGRAAETALSRVIGASALASVAVLCGAGPALNALWGGEKFPPERIAEVVWLLSALYALLPIAATAWIMRKVAVSLQLVREVYFALALLQFASALAAWLLIPWIGLAAVVVIHAMGAIGSYVAQAVVMRRARGRLAVRYPFGTLGRWAIAAIVGATFGMLLGRLLTGLTIELAPGRIVLLVTGGAVSAVAALVTLAVAIALGVPEARQLMSKARSLFTKTFP